MVAYFPVANALYPGDRVEIMGVQVGAIDKIEPAGDKMKVTFHYSNKYKVPANAHGGDPQPDAGGVAAASSWSRPTRAGRCWPTTR